MTRKTTKNSSRSSASEGQWFRLSSYELEFDENGYAQRIVPRANAQLTTYRPFDKCPSVLIAAIKLGRFLEYPPLPATREEALSQHRDAISPAGVNGRARAILKFVNEYGPLGIFWECASLFYVDLLRQREGRFEMVYLNFNRQYLLKPSGLPVPLGSIELKDYARPFIFGAPFEPSIADAQFYEEKFLKRYAEPIAGVAKEFRDIFRWAQEWDRFRSDNFDTTSARQPVNYWQGSMGIAVNVREKKCTLGYTFQSLASALRMMLIFNQAGLHPIRFCVECGKPFEAKDERSQFCNEQCGGRNRQRRWYKNQPKAKGGSYGRKRKTAKKGR